MRKKIKQVIRILLVVPVLAHYGKMKWDKRQLRKKVKEKNATNFKEAAANIARGIGDKGKLYKELIISVHPDRFPEDLREEATRLSARITRAKRDYETLNTLKVEVSEFLLRIKSPV